MPALMCFGKEGSDDSPGRVHALRYVQWATEVHGCQDTAVHNLAVALYSQVQVGFMCLEHAFVCTEYEYKGVVLSWCTILLSYHFLWRPP